ncbi:MAG: iron export ABC transporter permease subunit FetB [bacterium]
MTTPGLVDVGLAVILVAIAMAAGHWWRLPVAKGMALGSVRAFVQLIAVGYALHFVFDLQSIWLILGCFAIMMTVGAHAAAGRVKALKGAFWITLTAILVGSVFTLSTMLLVKIITWEARFIIPLAGMIIGNSMNATALAIDRLCSDIRTNRLAVETSLALGKSWRQAAGPFMRAAARTGMVSILNFMKTVGIVALPGAMTGMILAGAEPLDAVMLQLIVAYMLLAATTLSSIVAAELTVRRFFTTAHQLRHDV